MARWSMPGRRPSAILLGAGLVVYAAGVVLAPHAGALVCRVVGLALLTAAAALHRSLTGWTMLAIVAGAELGADVPRIGVEAKLPAELFLRLIRLIVAPLLLGSLTTGIAGHGRLRELGSLAWKSILYFELITTLALLLGAAAAHIMQPGRGVVLPSVSAHAAASSAGPPSAGSLLLNAVPENVALAVANNQILQIAVFSVLFGVALALLPEHKSAPLLAVLRSLTDAMFSLTRIIMFYAPVAAGAAMAYSVASMGVAALLPLGKLLLTFYGSAVAFVVLVLAPLALLARVPLRRFVQAAGEPVAIGFATSASEAALPLAMERMEEFGVPRRVVAFVIPTGYSFNMDGASLYLAVAAQFAVQASGQPLAWGTEVSMLAGLAIASKGMAGVPRATLTVLLATASSYHLPVPALMMIVGIDALMDMGRTAVNVLGNCMAAAVLGRWKS